MKLWQRLAAEFIGTFWLVLGGCGSAVLAAKFFAGEGAERVQLGIGLVGVSLAFGLTVLTMAYTIGHVSGCHLNPAVTLGLFIGRRFDAKDVIPYVVVQVLGAIAAAGVLWVIALGQAGATAESLRKGPGAFATNGYGDLSPGGYALAACFLIEIVMTAGFLFIILGSTDSRAPKHLGPIAIGLGLTLIHLISIPVTNTSVNPARSTGPALFVGGTPLSQLWLFWLAPLLGGAVGALIYLLVAGDRGGAAGEEN